MGRRYSAALANDDLFVQPGLLWLVAGCYTEITRIWLGEIDQPPVAATNVFYVMTTWHGTNSNPSVSESANVAPYDRTDPPSSAVVFNQCSGDGNSTGGSSAFNRSFYLWAGDDLKLSSRFCLQPGDSFGINIVSAINYNLIGQVDFEER